MSDKYTCSRCETEKDASAFHRGFRHCIECGKTGTLKPPAKPPANPEPVIDFEGAIDRAKKFVKETMRSVVVFHDERGGLSLSSVNNLDRLHITRNILFGFKLVKGKKDQKRMTPEMKVVEGGALW